MTQLALSYGSSDGNWGLHRSPILEPDLILDVPWGRNDNAFFSLMDIAKSASLYREDGVILKLFADQGSYKLFLRRQHGNPRIIGFGLKDDNQPRWFLTSVGFEATPEDIPKGIVNGVAEIDNYETIVETLDQFCTLRKRCVGRIGLAHNITVGGEPGESWLH